MKCLLDLFCGAGGAAVGYARAGFEVVGVDNLPMKRYPFEFHQADALEYLAEHGHEFDAIHASPPCQCYSALKHLSSGKHPDLVGVTREALKASGKAWIIENVPGAPLSACLVLCGTMFGLRTPCGAELRRHRLFETNWFAGMVPPCAHGTERISVCGDTPHNPRTWRAAQRGMGRVVSIAGHTAESRQGNFSGVPPKRSIMVVGDTARDPAAERRKYRTISVTGSTPQQNVERNQIRETFSIEEARIAMGIDWMVMKELSQAIPPSYTEWIGRELLAYMEEPS